MSYTPRLDTSKFVHSGLAHQVRCELFPRQYVPTRLRAAKRSRANDMRYGTVQTIISITRLVCKNITGNSTDHAIVPATADIFLNLLARGGLLLGQGRLVFLAAPHQ